MYSPCTPLPNFPVTRINHTPPSLSHHTPKSHSYKSSTIPLLTKHFPRSLTTQTPPKPGSVGSSTHTPWSLEERSISLVCCKAKGRLRNDVRGQGVGHYCRLFITIWAYNYRPLQVSTELCFRAKAVLMFRNVRPINNILRVS